MGNKSKNRSNRLNPQDKPKPVAGQEYDVTQSLNKIRPYTKPTKRNNVGDGTYSDEEQELRGRRGYISTIRHASKAAQQEHRIGKDTTD